MHTTGTDIPQTATAHAVLTLAADLVFRDYAQAAYRMRGIGKGQRIILFVIPAYFNANWVFLINL